MSIEKFIEQQIQKAQAEGAFDNLPGAGQPLDLASYFQTPEDLRMAYALLKNSHFVPEEVEILREIRMLREQLAEATDEAQKRRLTSALNDKTLSYNLLVEKYKRRR